MVAREGQHIGLETKAFSKYLPLSLKRFLVFGMYLRSSLRISSVRMKTMFGLAGAVRDSVVGTSRRLSKLDSCV
jgi:hypothetical protein